MNEAHVVCRWGIFQWFSLSLWLLLSLHVSVGVVLHSCFLSASCSVKSESCFSSALSEKRRVTFESKCLSVPPSLFLWLWDQHVVQGRALMGITEQLYGPFTQNAFCFEKTWDMDSGKEQGLKMCFFKCWTHTPIPPQPPPVLLFLPGNSCNLSGPNLFIWIITSLCYSKVVQLSDLVWNTSPHTINTIHKFQTFCDLKLDNLQPNCAVDICSGSRHRKLNLASVVEIEGEESGGAPAKKN